MSDFCAERDYLNAIEPLQRENAELRAKIARARNCISELKGMGKYAHPWSNDAQTHRIISAALKELHE